MVPHVGFRFQPLTPWTVLPVSSCWKQLSDQSLRSIKKEPVTPDMIKEIIDKHGSSSASLKDLSLAAICCIGFKLRGIFVTTSWAKCLLLTTSRDYNLFRQVRFLESKNARAAKVYRIVNVGRFSRNARRDWVMTRRSMVYIAFWGRHGSSN